MRCISEIFSFKLKKRKSVLFIYAFIFTISILFFSYACCSEEKVQYLKKIGEIKEGFSSEKENFFVKITGLCCDDEGNLCCRFRMELDIQV